MALQYKLLLTNRRSTAVSLTVLIFAYLLCHSWSPVVWIIQAHIRLLLIKLLPLWDWTNLYRSDCLISNPHYVREIPRGTCNECEWIDKFTSITTFDTEVVGSNMLLNIPMIWNSTEPIETYSCPTVPTVLQLLVIEDAINHSNYLLYDVTMPKTRLEAKCHLQSSVSAPMAQSLTSGIGQLNNENLNRQLSSSWFAFWENCDKTTAKPFRQLFPSQLISSLGCTGRTSVLLAHNYSSTLKPVFSESKFILFWQLVGSSMIQLEPFDDCQLNCPIVKTGLTETQFALVSQWNWDVSYKSIGDGNSITLAIGCH